jgi:hypothetical protein
MAGSRDSIDIATLSRLWTLHWPDIRPITYELRGSAHDQWVRFHSLPHSKRYAESEDEYQEILRRGQMILAELSGPGTDNDSIVVVRYAWSTSPEPDPEDVQVADLLNVGLYWTSLPIDPDQRTPDEEEQWVHLFVHKSFWRGGELDSLFLRVADDHERALIMPTDLGWLLAPYDGGMDVVVATTKMRDELKGSHADWLSALPSGL